MPNQKKDDIYTPPKKPVVIPQPKKLPQGDAAKLMPAWMVQQRMNTFDLNKAIRQQAEARMQAAQQAVQQKASIPLSQLNASMGRTFATSQTQNPLTPSWANALLRQPNALDAQRKTITPNPMVKNPDYVKDDLAVKEPAANRGYIFGTGNWTQNPRFEVGLINRDNKRSAWEYQRAMQAYLQGLRDNNVPTTDQWDGGYGYSDGSWPDWGGGGGGGGYSSWINNLTSWNIG